MRQVISANLFYLGVCSQKRKTDKKKCASRVLAPYSRYRIADLSLRHFMLDLVYRESALSYIYLNIFHLW